MKFVNNIIWKTAVSVFFALLTIGIMISACDNTVKQYKAEIDTLIPKIMTYDYGQERNSLTRLHAILKESLQLPDLKDFLENSLDEILLSDAGPAAKQFACRQLSIIGTAVSVPVVKKLLNQENTFDFGLYALERINAPEAEKALVEEAGKASGEEKAAIISSLGMKKAESAVVLLTGLLNGKDTAVAETAASALGKIGGTGAAEALKNALGSAEGSLKRTIADAYLLCADGFLSGGRIDKAQMIYGEIYKSGYGIPVRSAALKGLVSAEKPNTVKIVAEELKSGKSDLEAYAISLLREAPDNADFRAIYAMANKLSPAGMIQLLGVIEDRKDASGRETALVQVNSRTEQVRIAALKALAAVGTKDDVAVLAGIASRKKGMERETARTSLALLKGAGINDEIVRLIGSADTKVEIELIRALGQRYAKDTVSTLLAAAADKDRNVRKEAFQSLAIIAPAERITEIIQLLIKEDTPAIRKEAEKSVIASARNIPEGNGQAKQVLDAFLATDNTKAKGSLLLVLGRIGDKAALPLLTDHLKSKNSVLKENAINGLSFWPDDEPVDALLETAAQSTDKTHKILALRAFLGLLKKKNDRTEDESLRLYKEALKLAQGVDEKRLAISGIASVHSMEALDMVTAYFTDTALQPEAEVSAFRIIDNMKGSKTAKVREVLETVLKNTKNKSLKNSVQRKLDSLK